MPVYLTPGVYVEEVPGTPPIAGVGTSTAAFIGVVDTAAPFTMPQTVADPTVRFTVAPVNTAVLVTNFEQFKTHFGTFQAGNQVLAHAVFGFFQNGGTRCYVIRVADITNAAEVTDALLQLAKIDEIAIVAAPGARTADVQTAVIASCEDLKDRFAVLDGQITTTIDVPSIQGTVGDSNFAAMYFPQVEIIDQTLVAEPPKPIEEWKAAAGARLFLPPSAHMAGIYARVDQARGVHKAPANEKVIGALGLEYLVTSNEQGDLNKNGINVIRGFDGNIKVWGARTLGGDTNGEFKYINVRRLMNFMRESIDEGTQFVVFEPNNPALWQKIVRSVTAFLTNVWRDGALFGLTPEQAFFVKCDETTNPPEVRELGQVVTEIGVAIVKPAEFVIFRISQVTLAG
ncbi:MAG TPA: phage tail sheath C-terminal domain-containing protein [Pyrinomonadaceae bacterium]|nr:phage tail sheath C-terminal domain-containing protein [Pyrinomonadaceae bacterium]